MGGTPARGIRAIAVACATLLVTTTLVSAQTLVDVPGVATVGAYEGSSYGASGGGSSSGGAGPGGGSESSSTCVLPFQGSCLFEFEENEVTQSDDVQNATWYYYNYENVSQNGVYANLVGGVVFTRVYAASSEVASGEGASSYMHELEYEYYENNLGYSEEHLSEELEENAFASEWEETVSGYGAEVVVDGTVAGTTVGGASFEVGREVGENAGASSASGNSFSIEEDGYFGIPLQENGEFEEFEMSEEEVAYWRTLLVDGNVFLVNPADDGQTIEIVGLRFDQGTAGSEGSSSSSSSSGSYQRIFGFTVFEEEESSAEEHHFAMFEEWLRLTIDVANGTVAGGVSYERGTSSTYDYVYEHSATEVAGIPIYGEDYVEETSTESAWRELTFDLDVAHGVGTVEVAGWENDGSSQSQWEDTTSILGIPIGSSGSESSWFHSDGLQVGANIGGGLLWIGARYANETSYSQSEEDFVFGGPLVGFSEEEFEHVRSLGIAAGSDVLASGASVGYEESQSESSQFIRLFGDDFAGIESEEEYVSYDAAANAQQILVFSFHYLNGESEDSIEIAGFPLGIEHEYEEMDLEVSGAAPAGVLVYSFEHHESRDSYTLEASDDPIGRLQHNESSDKVNVVVLNGLAGVSAERSFSDTHLFAGDDVEIIDFSGQSAAGETNAGPASAEASVFFGYLEFADAIAVGLIVAHYCVDPGADLPTDLVTDAIGDVDGTAGTIAEIAVFLAELALCPIPVFAPVPYFLLSPCILVPVAHFLVFSVVGPLTVAVLPHEVDDLADFLVDEAGDESWDLYDDYVGCIWLTIPSEVRNPQPGLTALDAGNDQLQPVLGTAWETYDGARRDAYAMLDDLFGVDALAPDPNALLARPPGLCEDASPLCADAPASCVAAAARIRVPPNDAHPEGIDEIVSLARATALTGPAHAAAAEHALQPLVTVSGASADCAAASAPHESACGEASLAAVEVDLTSLGLDVTVEADLVREHGCSISAARGFDRARVANVTVSLAGTGIRQSLPPPNTVVMLGPAGFVALNEAFTTKEDDCVRRDGDALRVVAYDDDGNVSAEIVIASVSTMACRSAATIASGVSVLSAHALKPGATVSTSALVEGAPGGAVPTGQVTFFLCQPSEVSGNRCHAGSQVGATKTLDANGEAASDATANTRVVGTYCWRVAYAGDGSYLPANDPDAGCFATAKQPLLAFTLEADPQGVVAPGDFVRALATAARAADGPRPTARVSFALCAPAAVTEGVGCEAGAAVGSPAPLNLSDVAASASTNATVAIGTFCWRAEFPGDDYYLPASATSDVAACFGTGKQQPTVTATASAASAVPGAAAVDRAVVRGLPGLPTPTGVARFYLCGPAEATAAGCDAGALVGEVPLVGGSAPSPVVASSLVAGRSCFRVEYPGDAFYVPASATGVAQCFATVRQPAAISVASTPGGTGHAPGATTSARAVVSGVGPTPTGTVAFTLCPPSDVTLTTGCLAPAGSAVGGAAALAGGAASSAASGATLALGTWCWRAAYSGDSYYLPATGTDAAGACFTTVRVAPTFALAGVPTGAGVSPGVSAVALATLAGASGAPTGRVQFFLCEPANVTAAGCPIGLGRQIGEARDLAAGTVTSSATDLTLGIGKHCWRASYSGDLFYHAASTTNAGAACFTTAKPAARMRIESVPTGLEILPGTSVYAAVNVTGTDRQPLPNGTVSFFLCRATAPTSEVTPAGCASGGVPVGGPVPLVNGEADSETTTDTTRIGLHCWRVEYSGDAFYLPTAGTGPGSLASISCFDVDRKTPEMETHARPSGVIGLDARVDDNAILFGGLGNPSPTGAVTFFLCQPWEVTIGVGCGPGNGTEMSAPRALDADARATSPATWRLGDELGASAAASAAFVVLGAPGNDTAGVTDAGAAHVFSATTGRLLATIDNPEPNAGDRFGAAVAVVGSRVLVGAPFDDVIFSNTGRVFAFEAATGALAGSLALPAGAGNETGFALAALGSNVVVGAPGNLSGIAWIASPSTLAHVATLFNPTPAAGDRFGAAVGAFGDDALVGAPLDDGGATDSGAAYRFSAFGVLQSTMKGVPAKASDLLGSSVAGAGTLALVGAPGNDTGAADAGVVLAFDASGGFQRALANPTPAPGDKLGTSLAEIAGNALVGAPFDDATGTDAGAAHVFVPTTGALVRTLTNATPTVGARLGASVAAAGSAAILGAPGYAAGVGTGAGYATAADGALSRTWVNFVRGLYCWRATYSGSSLYKPVEHTNFNTECFRPMRDPGKTDLPFTTAIAPALELAPKSNVSASRIVPVDFQDSNPFATGTVQFWLCAPTQVTAAGCPSPSGTALGTVSLVDGRATAPTTNATTAVGKYCYRAAYSGDPFYNAATYTDATTMCFRVKNAPSLTLSSKPGGSVRPAREMRATASVGGAFGAPGGSVQVWLCRPAEVNATLGCPGGAGTRVGASIPVPAGGSVTSQATPVLSDELGAGVVGVNGRIALGSPGNDTGAADAGAAYLFDGSTGDLVRAYLNPDPDAGDRFGETLSRLGNDLLVAAPGADGAGAVYRFNGTTHALTRTYAHPSLVSGARFGEALAGAGTRIMVGAPGESAAYLLDAATGALVTRFAGVGPDRFGASVAAVGADFLVGAPGDDTVAPDAGLVRRYSGAGSLVRTYAAPAAGAAGDALGGSVAATGGRVYAGAPLDDVAAPEGGSVVAFDAATGAVIATWPSPVPAANARFGASLAALDDDVVAGAPFQEGGVGAVGAAFVLNGTTGAAEKSFLNPVPTANGRFGAAVSSLRGDAIVGAPGHDVAAATTGAAYLLLGPVEDPGDPGAGANETEGVFANDVSDVLRTFANFGLGTHCFRAEYSGDNAYLPASATNAGAACFTVKFVPALALVSQPTGAGAVPGAPSVATLELEGPTGAPGPSGEVRFFLCHPAAVTSAGCPRPAGVAGGAITVTNATAAARSNAVPAALAIGQHCWRAEYAGDALYLAADSLGLGAPCFATVRQPVAIAAAATPSGGDVAPWTAARHAVSITGAGPQPTGSVRFYLCGPADVTPAGCPAGGAAVGGPVTLSQGLALSPPTSGVLAIGKHCWRAEYAGEALYLPGSATSADASCFTTVRKPAALAVQATPGGAGLAPWLSFAARATAAGGGPAPTGAVTFHLCSLADVLAGFGCADGAPVGGAVALASGLADSAATSGVVPLGAHCWRVAYAGDAVYLPGEATDFAGACFSTAKQPVAVALVAEETGEVAPWTPVRASATVAGASGAGPTPTGDVRFVLCEPDASTVAGCADPAAPQVGPHVALASGAAASEATSEPLSLGSHCWRVEYLGDALYLAGSATSGAACVLVEPACPHDAGDAFARAVAEIAGDLLVGLPADAVGAACRYDGATGAFEAVYANPTLVAADAFGAAVAGANGKVLVGAPGNDTLAQDSGRAYVFDATTGALLYEIPNPAPSAGDRFGAAVAAIGDDWLVGAPGDDSGATDAGAAFVVDGATGRAVRTIANPAPGAGDAFGTAVASVGGRALVGAPFDDAGGEDAGAAYLFEPATGELARVASRYSPHAFLGSSVAAFGAHLLVGAPGASVGGDSQGAAYLFNGTLGAPAPTSPDATFGPDAALAALAASANDVLLTIVSPTGVDGGRFGAAVAAAGGRILVGAPGEDGGAGAAHLFDDAGTITSGLLGEAGLPPEAAPVLASVSVETAEHLLSFARPASAAGFGEAVGALLSHALVGAPADGTFGAGAGAAFRFDPDSGALLATYGGI